LPGALEAPSLADVQDPTGRQFRAFAEQTRSDLKALAACLRGGRQTLPPAEAEAIERPVLIAVGTKDQVAGSAEPLVALIPGARALDIPNITCSRWAIRSLRQESSIFCSSVPER